MSKDELIIQLVKVALGSLIGGYFLWWSLEVLKRLPPSLDRANGRRCGAGAGRRWAYARRRARKRLWRRRACRRSRGSSPAAPVLSGNRPPALPALHSSLRVAPPRRPTRPETGTAAAKWPPSGVAPSPHARDSAGGLRPRARCVDTPERRARSGRAR